MPAAVPLGVLTINFEVFLAIPSPTLRVLTARNRPVTVEVPELVVSAKAAVPVNAGESAKTAAPDPVASVKAARRLALEGVASHVVTPDANPVRSDMDGCALLMTPPALIAVRKLFLAPVSAITVVLTTPSGLMAFRVALVLSAQTF